MKKAFGDSKKTFTITYENMKTAIQKIINGAVINMKCTKGIITEFYFYLEKDYSPSSNSKFGNQCKSGQLILK